MGNIKAVKEASALLAKLTEEEKRLLLLILRAQQGNEDSSGLLGPFLEKAGRAEP